MLQLLRQVPDTASTSPSTASSIASSHPVNRAVATAALVPTGRHGCAVTRAISLPFGPANADFFPWPATHERRSGDPRAAHSRSNFGNVACSVWWCQNQT
jgi:hypothetical protein